jgi:hypothetical protein
LEIQRKGLKKKSTYPPWGHHEGCHDAELFRPANTDKEVELLLLLLRYNNQLLVPKLKCTDVVDANQAMSLFDAGPTRRGEKKGGGGVDVQVRRGTRRMRGAASIEQATSRESIIGGQREVSDYRSNQPRYSISGDLNNFCAFEKQPPCLLCAFPLQNHPRDGARVNRIILKLTM